MSNTPRIDLVERNLIINGNFDFWQRGTSKSLSNTSACVADRFLLQNTSTTRTYTGSQSTDVPTQVQSGYQSRYSLLMTNGTGGAVAAGDLIDIQYRVEGQDYQQIHGRAVRVQFWVKSSLAGTYSLSLSNAASNFFYVTTYTVVTSNAWQKVSIDIPANTAGTWTFDNTLAMIIMFGVASGSSWQTSSLNAWGSGSNSFLANTQANWAATTGATFQIAQVMLIPQDFTQAGSTTVDVPFQRCGRSIGHELQLCQRYYEKSYDLDQVPGTITDGWVANGFQGFPGTGRAAFPICYRTTKRATPSLTFYNPSTGASGSISINVGTISSLVANFQRTGSVVADATNSNGVGTSIGANIHFTADAEL